MTRVQILGAPQSPLVWAVRMVAAEKDIDTDFVPVRPHAPEVVSINPFGKIPVMRHGSLELGESRAIARYLDDLSTKNPLMPRDTASAARTEQWIMHFHTECVPAMLSRYIIQYFLPQTADGSPDRPAIDAALPQLSPSIGIIDRRLSDRDYLADTFTLADIFFAPILHYLGTLPESSRLLAASRRVSAYRERLASRPAFSATFPPPLPGQAAA